MNYERQKLTPIYTALSKYKEDPIVHFDVPGHKKNKDSFIAKALGADLVSLDANSTKELDMLSHPVGIIAEAEDLLAEAYGADDAFMLVNGSTSGVLAMILSACSPKDKIIIPRNVHKSVINAIILAGATPIFIQPEIDYDYGIANGIKVDAVKETIKAHPDAKALFVINPTYFGVASDLRKIIKICHRHNIAVLVDEAHGAHLPFHPNLPDCAMKLGADLSTASLHKTIGSLTQSSALFHNDNGFIDIDKVRMTINLMQTTSASYLLLSSMDLARSNIALKGKKIFSSLLKKCSEAKAKLSQLPGISVITEDYIDEADENGVYDFDETKFVVKVNELGLSGFQVYTIFKNEYNIQLELAESYVVLAVVGVGDTDESIDKLVEAFNDISKRFYGKQDPYVTHIADFFEKPKTIVLLR
ncbi:MAG: aminotransferase class I/II-fold pyridoxal phosphate-dependent enzyme, partial [Firmicutes bacterium]|nr:aminotransferase class I/II-fold pyridoxal phosphate-dependent enzyme [Bacillota bacterium]